MRHFLRTVIGALAVCALAFIALLTFADVVARNAFNSPISSATELTEISLAAITFILYPLLALERRHLTVDLFTFVTSKKVRYALDAVAALIGAVLFGIVAWRLGIIADRTHSYGDTTLALGLPLWPVIAGMAVLSAITAGAFLISLRPSATDR